MRLLCLIMMLVLPLPATAQSYPEFTTTYVNDFADLIDDATEARIVEMLKDVRNERGVEMTVVTINSRLDYGSSTSIEPFATGLFNHWGVGDAVRNDGIMVLVAHVDRDMRIELGAGYPPGFDDVVKTIIDHTFIPYFMKSEFAEGIEAGVAETIRRTALDFTDEGPTLSSRARLQGSNVLHSATSGGWLTWVLGIGLSLGGAVFGFRRWRKMPQRCPECRRKMVQVGGVNDPGWDQLTKKLKNAAKRKSTELWRCNTDGHIVLKDRWAWFGTNDECPQCRNHAIESKRKVITTATRSRKGKAHIDYLCAFCAHHYEKDVVIPMIVASSSSSSGSSGSFGGGSSSGGGASGSW